MSSFHAADKGAKPCPFCQSTFLFFNDGAIACDTCQAEGPFFRHIMEGHSDRQIEEITNGAIKVWNARSYTAWTKATD